ncbi:hypothetical protein Mapa_003175 [Marchantia paleacea]|nr:hypothetical protein Mapa_003175 [Marchantia paleacea]
MADMLTTLDRTCADDKNTENGRKHRPDIAQAGTCVCIPRSGMMKSNGYCITLNRAQFRAMENLTWTKCPANTHMKQASSMNSSSHKQLHPGVSWLNVSTWWTTSREDKEALLHSSVILRSLIKR